MKSSKGSVGFNIKNSSDVTLDGNFIKGMDRAAILDGSKNVSVRKTEISHDKRQQRYETWWGLVFLGIITAVIAGIILSCFIHSS